MNKLIKYCIVSFMLIVTCISGVFAEENIIDQNHKGSITLYKLVSKDGTYKDGNGYEQDLNDVGNEPLAGVTFKFLKVGELKQVDNDLKLGYLSTT